MSALQRAKIPSLILTPALKTAQCLSYAGCPHTFKAPKPNACLETTPHQQLTSQIYSASSSTAPQPHRSKAKMTLMASPAAERRIPQPHGEEKRGWRGEEGTVPAPATCSISQEQAGPAAQSCSAGLSTQLLKAIRAGAKRGGSGCCSRPRRAAAAASLQGMLSRAGAAV